MDGWIYRWTIQLEDEQYYQHLFLLFLKNGKEKTRNPWEWQLLTFCLMILWPSHFMFDLSFQSPFTSLLKLPKINYPTIKGVNFTPPFPFYGHSTPHPYLPQFRLLNYGNPNIPSPQISQLLLLLLFFLHVYKSKFTFWIF